MNNTSVNDGKVLVGKFGHPLGFSQDIVLEPHGSSCCPFCELNSFAPSSSAVVCTTKTVSDYFLTMVIYNGIYTESVYPTCPLCGSERRRVRCSLRRIRLPARPTTAAMAKIKL